jgi:nitrogen-specific signal transduction histidine kinase
MQADGPFLTVPITGKASADGRLVSADPQLERLHNMAGGREGEAIALPELYDLVHLAINCGIRLERRISVADSHHDISLWVEAKPSGDFCDITILGWREQWNASDQEPLGEERDYIAVVADTVSIDAAFRLINGPDWIYANNENVVAGDHVSAFLAMQASPNSDLPLIDLLAERKTIRDMPVDLKNNAERCLLSLDPVYDQGNAFLGYSGSILRLELQPYKDVRQDSDSETHGLDFGEQLAPILKQPLSRIIANAETIHARLNGPIRENYTGYAQDIANAARHLAELVSDMEDLSAIDRPDFAVASDRIELGDIARRVAGLLALKAADHHITISLPAEDLKVEATAEFRRVLQIMLNLVGNAIRYAPSASLVSIQMHNADTMSLITVSDQGAGIAMEDREKVFEKFERLGRSGDGGSGLGLYISRKLARAMKGDLTVSKADGGGARFELRLPKA